MSALKNKREGVGILALLLRWWRADRVRVSPSDGRLLRLQPPCIVRIDGRVFEVVERHVASRPDGSYVAYLCDDGGERCELRVFPVGETCQPRVLLIEEEQHRLLAADEVEVYG